LAGPCSLIIMNEAEIKQLAEQIAANIADDQLSEEVIDLQPEPQDKEHTSYTVSEMAAMCGVVDGTWNVWVRKGYAPQPTIIDGARRWPEKTIDAWKKELNKKSRQAQRQFRSQQKQ